MGMGMNDTYFQDPDFMAAQHAFVQDTNESYAHQHGDMMGQMMMPIGGYMNGGQVKNEFMWGGEKGQAGMGTLQTSMQMKVSEAADFYGSILILT